MTTHGILEVKPSAGNNSYRTQEIFVSLMKFLTSSYAAAAGITRIASQTSSGGSNFNYWDESNPTQNNAWAVFKWGNAGGASTPFYAMFHLSMSGVLGNPGLPALIDGVTNVYGCLEGIGVAVAMREDGGNPWNGTAVDNGTDTKGDPVWTAGGSNLLVWPRSNSAGGANVSKKQEMASLFGIFDNAPFTDPSYPPKAGTRFHFICNEDNFGCMTSPDADMRHMHLFFCRYTPIAGTELTNTFPYFMIKSWRYTNNAEPSVLQTTYGPPNLTDPALATTADGGIAHPSDRSLGVKTLYICAQDGLLDSSRQPNTVLATSTYDEVPFWVAMREPPHYQIAGSCDFFRAVQGPYSYDAAPDLSRITISTCGTLGNQCYTVPWDGVTIPAASWSTRTGSMF